MASVQFWQVDAFTDRPFAGNPAAVCWLEEERDARWMQDVAAEMNLSETAFVRRLENGFELRWFTPAVEVDLCGHATLASARALWSDGLVPTGQAIHFHSRSGLLTATQRGPLIELDFPATPPVACAAPEGLLHALDIDAAAEPTYIGRSKFDCFVVVSTAEQVRALRPDFRRLATVTERGLIVTAAADVSGVDFISRFFAPAAGIDEDPVTGSAHCCLGPYWSARLGKHELVGYQASRRGGTVYVRHHGERVMLGGQAVLVSRGQLLAG